jgi:hypothetical protein
MIERYGAENKQLKFLQLGLGCNMSYGPDSNVKLWSTIFEGQTVDFWETDANATCVEQSRARGQLNGISVVSGDMSVQGTLQALIQQSGGAFDVIIDDGGHRTSAVLNALETLWPELNPGGWYFIEDVQASSNPDGLDQGFPPTTLVFQSWVEALMSPTPVSSDQLTQYPLPEKCDMILCQRAACAMHKEESSGL